MRETSGISTRENWWSHALPIGTVLTIAAAGSEGSPDSVITLEDGHAEAGRHR